MSKHNVTSIDVARLADVSQSAVSRTFTPGASVSEGTRAKVLDAAGKLGYRPNAAARTLATRLSQMIAVVVSNLQNQFYPVVIEQLSQRLQKDGYHVLLFITDIEDADELLVELMRYQVDGIVMASTNLSSAMAQQIAAARVPVVMFNRVSRAGNAGSISTVSSDNHGGGRAVAHFLADGGHRRVAYLAGAEDSSTNQDRERGLADGLAERGMRTAARAVGNYQFDLAAQATLEMFTHRSRTRLPDALFVASDHMAFAAMDTLRGALGLRVPEDVSVVGFDNVQQAEWGAYRLTTVEQDVGQMIEATVRMLLQQLADDAVTRGRCGDPGAARGAQFGPAAAMKGFDPQFRGLDDYIRVITARIWEGREVERIRDWYGDDCAVITPGGTSSGVDAVVRGTLETLTQFPDRRLLCEDIVSAGDDVNGFLSSHRIASPMTHSGPGIFGAPTGQRLLVRTVADCVCRDNRIVHEWLVRDQGAIARQTGSTPQALAALWLQTRGMPTLPLHQPPAPAWWRDPLHTTPGAALLAHTYRRLWAGDLAVLATAADEAIDARLPSGDSACGVAALESFWFGMTAAFHGAELHIDSLAERIEPGRTPRAAMRWRIVGRHAGAGRYGAASGRPIEILGITHAEIDTSGGAGRILREWIMVDEVALWMQLLCR